MIIVRVFVAALAAILVQPVLAFCWMVLPLLLMGASIGSTTWIATIFLLAAISATPFVLLIGVPVSLILHRLERLNWWPLAIVGAVVGGLVGGRLTFALHGLVGATAYYVAWRRFEAMFERPTKPAVLTECAVVDPASDGKESSAAKPAPSAIERARP